MVKGRLEPAWKVDGHEARESVGRIKGPVTTNSAKPSCPGGDVADLLGVDDFECCRAGPVPIAVQLFDHARRHIKAACLKHHGSNR